MLGPCGFASKSNTSSVASVGCTMGMAAADHVRVGAGEQRRKVGVGNVGCDSGAVVGADRRVDAEQVRAVAERNSP